MERSLAGYSPWGRKESDTTEWLTLTQICNVVLVSSVQESDVYTYFFQILFSSRLLQNIEYFVLYSRPLLIIYVIYSRMYMLLLLRKVMLMDY